MNGIRTGKLNRKVCGWLVRGGIAAEMNVGQACTSKAYTEGHLGPKGEKTTVVIYCGNQV